ncbi:MAG: sensor histidine kinase [Bacteroidota bacterium]
MQTINKRPTTKLKLNLWLTIILFVVNTLIISIVFLVLYSNLKVELINRTRDQLKSINILKKRLLDQFLTDKYEEASHIINYYKTHTGSKQDLQERLISINNTDEIKWVNADEVAFDNSLEFFATYNSNELQFNLFFGVGDEYAEVVLNLDAIREILEERTGLGLTGESYLVSEDFRLMTPSIFYPDKIPNTINCNTLGVSKAFEGLEGVEVYDDYRSVRIIGSFRLLEFHGIRAVMLTEIDYEEAMKPVWELRDELMVILLVILFFLLLISILIAFFLSRPILKLKVVSGLLSRGELPDKLPSPSPVYELSEITASMNQVIHALKKTVIFAQEIGKGKMDVPFEPLSDKDELGLAITRMRDQLISLDNEKSKLELYGKKILIDTQEKERESFARELHDGLGTLLTTMKLKMENIGLDNAKANELRELLDKTILETRSLARNLMPSVLMDFGLNETLNQLVRDIQHNTPIKVKFVNELESSKTSLDKGKSVGVYRIAQEAINNALKHANCTEIMLSVTEFDDQIVLYIKDNGTGFDPETQRGGGLGLRNMEERTRTLNGQLMIESGEDGTSIEVIIPL